MKHRCHFPECGLEVPPKLWGCKRHWFMLPIRIRNRIWQTYVPGQEVRKDPSREYLDVARHAQEWIQENLRGEIAMLKARNGSVTG